MAFSLKMTKRPPTAYKIAKQFRFGTAVGLTQTAKEGQKAVVGAVTGKFTYRNRWLPQGNRFGIKVKPAKPSDLVAEVRTRASWLEKQKEGGRVTANTRKRVFPYQYGGKTYIARPSSELRPRGSTKVLGKRLWPNNLNKKKTFVITGKGGQKMLMMRFGPGKRDVAAMYILDEAISIRPVDTFYEPIEKVIKRRLNKNIVANIEKALRTMK